MPNFFAFFKPRDIVSGEKNKKFSKKRLYSYFEEIYCLPFSEQKGKLQVNLVNWQEDENQIDDILILGFAI